MEISVFYDFPRPWHWAEICVLGIWTLRDNGMLEIALGLYFLNVGIRIEWRVANAKM